MFIRTFIVDKSLGLNSIVSSDKHLFRNTNTVLGYLATELMLSMMNAGRLKCF